MNSFFDWTTLATFAGCVTATGVIVQFIKNTDLLKKIPTQIVSFAISLILLVAATYFTGGLSAATVAIIPFNAIAISAASNGAYVALEKVTAAQAKNAATDSLGDLNQGSSDNTEDVKAESSDTGTNDSTPTAQQ